MNEHSSAVVSIIMMQDPLRPHLHRLNQGRENRACISALDSRCSLSELWVLPQVSTLAARVGTFSPPSLRRFATQGLLPFEVVLGMASLCSCPCVWLCVCEDLTMIY